jgi:hypothetical protein
MNAATLTVGDSVIFRDEVGELPATYLGHNSHGIVVAIDGVSYTVHWDSRHLWVANPVTGEAYTRDDPSDPVLETLPADLE